MTNEPTETNDISADFLDGLPSPLWADDASVLFYRKWSQAISILARRDLEMIDFAVSNPNAVFARMETLGFVWDEDSKRYTFPSAVPDFRSPKRRLEDAYASGLLYGDALADFMAERDSLLWWSNLWRILAFVNAAALIFVGVVTRFP
jgi:hypothetical protein